ncbi:MAG: EamA family transporter [Candidatus Sericytochromatia bacterium]|nr:EamA family transporter [Candidatus Sericytochromatia bacterium]
MTFPPLPTLLLTLVTVLLWGLIPIIDKLALNHQATSPLLGITIRACAVAVLALPALALSGNGWQALRQVPPSALALFAASGIVSLLLAQYTYYALLKQADVSRLFPFLFAAAPVVTMVLGVVYLGETWRARQVLGAILVILGGILLL